MNFLSCAVTGDDGKQKKLDKDIVSTLTWFWVNFNLNFLVPGVKLQ